MSFQNAASEGPVSFEIVKVSDGGKIVPPAKVFFAWFGQSCLYPNAE
jgi:hypothetical protein